MTPTINVENLGKPYSGQQVQTYSKQQNDSKHKNNSKKKLAHSGGRQVQMRVKQQNTLQRNDAYIDRNCTLEDTCIDKKQLHLTKHLQTSLHKTDWASRGTQVDPQTTIS